MIAANAFEVFKNVSQAGEFETSTVGGENLTVQVSGSATGVALTIYGQVDFMSTDWTPVSCVNLTTLEFNNSITAKGLYILPITGLARIKFALTSVSGGEISVFSRITKGD